MLKLIPINLPKRLVQMNTLRLHAPYELGANMRKSAEDPVLKESKRLVPVLTGALRDTGKVHPLQKLSGMKFKVDITYGGYSEKLKKDVNYAVIQHYTYTFRHPRGGQALFLQVPLFMFKPLIAERMATRLWQLTQKYFTG